MNNFTYLKDKNFSHGRNYIGASDVPTLALLNLKYGQTPYGLWEVLTGRAEPWAGNDRTKVGKLIEPLILSMSLEELKILNSKEKNKFLYLAYKENNKFKKNHLFTEFVCPDYPFIKSHPDLINTKHEIGIEAKASGYFGSKRNEDLNYGYDLEDLTANGIPSSVYLQVQTQMMCAKVNKWYVGAFLDGVFKLYTVASHKKNQEKILATCEKFWRCVEKDEPPKPESWKDVVKIFPNIDIESKTVLGGEELEKIEKAKDRKKYLSNRIKKHEAEIDDIKKGVGIAMGESKYLESSEGIKLGSVSDIVKFTLKNYKDMDPERFNKLKEDGFINESKFRTLRF